MDDTINIPLSYHQSMDSQRLSVERPAIIEQLRAGIRGEQYHPAKRKQAGQPSLDPETARRLFTIETGNRWMELGEREPAAKMLFGEFWHQGELCILFANANAGKSILAVQMASNIALAKATGPFTCNAKHERVLYIDFELTTTQFYQRYSHPDGDHQFPDNFYRAQFNPENGIPANFKGYDDFLITGLEQKLVQVKATVLIIDNISCLRGGTESAAVARRLMRSLKSLKANHKLSILVLAHTPKRRNAARPISADDLHGSKLLINFADSAFAIGTSTTEANLSYIKQIKQRNTQQIYGEGNVALCRITKAPLSAKKPANFLHFNFEGYAAEQPHVQIPGRHGYNRAAVNQHQLASQVTALTAQGNTQRQVAEKLNMALGTVNKLANYNKRQQNNSVTALQNQNTPFVVNDLTPSAAAGNRYIPAISKSPGSQLINIPPRLRHHINPKPQTRNAIACTQQYAETVAGACANGPP